MKAVEDLPVGQGLETPLDPASPLAKLVQVVMGERDDLPSALSLFRHAGLQPYQFFGLVELVKRDVAPPVDETFSEAPWWYSQSRSYTRLIRGAIFLHRAAKLEEAVIGRDWATGDAAHFGSWTALLLNALCLHRYLDKVVGSVLSLYKREAAVWEALELLHRAICTSMVSATLSGRSDVSDLAGAGQVGSLTN